jgi:hypothetical protein
LPHKTKGMLEMNHNKYINRRNKLSCYDITKIAVYTVLLLSIFSLRYIFPDSPLVQKYFTGYYAVLWFALLIIAALIHDYVINRKVSNQGSDQDK